MSEQRFEDILDECISRMLAGESWQQMIAAYPQHAAALMPALQSADATSRLQWSAPSASARATAQGRMMSEVAGAGSAAGRTAKGGVVMGVTQWFRRRPPVARLAAVGAAAAMFGAVTMGAAAATGNAPEPVRNLFGVADSAIRVELTGTIVGIDGNALTVDANGDLRMVIVGATTRFSRDGDGDSTLADFAPGELVEVEGKLQPDNTVLASRVDLEDADGVDETETPEIDDDDLTATPAPTDEPNDDPTPAATADDANDDIDCDNSGTGSPCGDDDRGEDGDDQGEDEGDDCDNSGPGSPCDDDENDRPTPSATEDDASDDDEACDNSGPGSPCDDDAEVDDDHSGSGSGDDEADDSSGLSDAEHDDDNSGPGGGD